MSSGGADGYAGAVATQLTECLHRLAARGRSGRFRTAGLFENSSTASRGEGDRRPRRLPSRGSDARGVDRAPKELSEAMRRPFSPPPARAACPLRASFALPGAVFRMVFPYELIREGPDPVAELFAVHKGPFSYDIPVRAAHDPVAVPLAVYIGPFRTTHVCQRRQIDSPMIKALVVPEHHRRVLSPAHPGRQDLRSQEPSARLNPKSDGQECHPSDRRHAPPPSPPSIPS